jgi:hypothetical protein
MAGRPLRRARIAAQWAEVDRMTSERAAGRVPNGGLPSVWRLFRVGSRIPKNAATHTLVRVRADKHGQYVYCVFGGKAPSVWSNMTKDRLWQMVEDGSGLLGTEVTYAFDDQPTAIQKETLRKIQSYESGGHERTKNPRNGQRYRVFESLGRPLRGPHLILVDTEAHEGFYPILYLGVYDDGSDDVSHTEVQAVSRNFDPTDYTFGREIPLSKVPARFRKYVKAHIAKG